MYLTLRSGSADRLDSVTTDAAAMAMLHESRRDNGVDTMRAVDGVALPAGQAVTMRPGGLHVMLMDLTRPLKAGDKFRATLTFDHAPPVTTTVQVVGPGASAP